VYVVKTLETSYRVLFARERYSSSQHNYCLEVVCIVAVDIQGSQNSKPLTEL